MRPERATARRKATWLVVGVVSAAILVAGTWLAAYAFVSPAQRDAAASPPAELPVMAKVERGDLVDQRTLPGEVRPTEEQSLSVLGMGDAKRSVITSVSAAPGSSLDIGDSPASVNGQPLIVLQSDFPMYRDLGPGDSGPDVEVLQRNLVKLGLLSDVDGEFGQRTANAIKGLYAQLGEKAPTRTIQPTTAEDGSEVISPSASASATEVYLPVWATLTTAATPAIVVSVPVVGALVGDDTSFAIKSDAVEIVATIPDSADDVVVAGLPVSVNLAGTATLKGRIGSVDTTATDGNTVSTATIELDDPSAVSAELAGQAASVMVEVRVLATDALILPLLAVAQHADGTTGTVQVRENGEDQLTAITVTILAVLDGQVAIADGTEVTESTEVRIG